MGLKQYSLPDPLVFISTLSLLYSGYFFNYGIKSPYQIVLSWLFYVEKHLKWDRSYRYNMLFVRRDAIVWIVKKILKWHRKKQTIYFSTFWSNLYENKSFFQTFENQWNNEINGKVCLTHLSQCPHLKLPENIKKPWGFLMISGGSKVLHWLNTTKTPSPAMI